MPFGAGSKFEKKDKKQDERAKSSKRITAVKEWNLPTKAMVRAFPDESGCMLKTGGRSVKKALAPGQFRDRLDSDSSELVRRPGMGLNLAAASMSAGLEVLDLGDDMTAQLGLKSLLDFVAKHDDLGELLKKAQKDYKGDGSDLAQSIAKLFSHLAGPEDNSDDLGKVLVKLADGSSRLFAFAIAASEIRALINKQKAWSKMVPELDKQAPGVRRWVAEPSDESLCEGLAQSLRSLFYWGGTKEKRRFGVEDVDSDASSGGAKKSRFGGTFLEKVKKSRKKASSSSTKTSGQDKKKRKQDKHSKEKKKRGSDSTSSPTPGFGLLKKKKTDDAGRRHMSKNPQDKIANFEEVDEGQCLTIDGVQHRNCCLPLAIARADAGLTATRTEVHKKAQEWMASLPAYLEHAVPANEASPGEMLFEDYLNKVVQDDESTMVCLVVAHEKITRVWAGPQATLEKSKVLYIKHVPGHFTALLVKDASQPTESVLKALPPVQGFSFIGKTDLKDKMCRAQQTAIEL